jgi:hypothetical protein
MARSNRNYFWWLRRRRRIIRPPAITHNQAGGYLGTVVLGRRAPFLVQTLGAGRVPALPMVPPTATLYDAGGNVAATFELPILDLAAGLFGMGVRLSTLAPGRYCVLYQYRVNGYPGRVIDFLDLAAGDDAGAVISLFAHDRPEARYVLAQLDGGRLVQGRNPKF